MAEPSLNRRAAVVLSGMAIVAAAVAVLMGTGSSDPERPAHEVPATIVSDCSRPVDDEINAWLATVPDGATVTFRPGSCYEQEQRLVLKNRADLVIDGRGATFKSSAPNDNSRLVPNWFLMRSDRITLKNMTIVGNFDDAGPPTPLRGSVTSNAGIGIFGGDDIKIADITIRNVFGDGVSVANAYYHDQEDPTPEFSRNVRLERLDISKAARHCVSPSQVTGFWLQDSTLNDCYLDGIDAEKDILTDPMSDLHFLRNTISNYFGLGLVVPIGGGSDGPAVDRIEIRDNKFPTHPFASVCNQAIVLGGYENQSFSDITVEDNEIRSWKVGIAVQGVTSGSIRNNVITHPPVGPDGSGPKVNDCGPEQEANVVLRDSPSVAVSNNG